MSQTARWLSKVAMGHVQFENSLNSKSVQTGIKSELSHNVKTICSEMKHATDDTENTNDTVETWTAGFQWHITITKTLLPGWEVSSSMNVGSRVWLINTCRNTLMDSSCSWSLLHNTGENQVTNRYSSISKPAFKGTKMVKVAKSQMCRWSNLLVHQANWQRDSNNIQITNNETQN